MIRAVFRKEPEECSINQRCLGTERQGRRNIDTRFSSKKSVEEKAASLTLLSTLQIEWIKLPYLLGWSGFSSTVGSLRGVPLCSFRSLEIAR